MGKLNNIRHELFCQYYITEQNGRMYNASAAALKAGFNKKTAYAQGHRLTKDPKILARIDELKKDALQQVGIDQLYILSKYKKILEDDIRNYISFRTSETSQEFLDHGNYIFELKNSENIDTWNISELKKGKDGQLTLKLHDKMRALSDLREYANIKGDVAVEESEQVIDNFSPVLNMIQKALSGGDDDE